jgi:hypothetical protein
MTKKDFELIAKVIDALPQDTSRMYVALAFANALKATNPNFNEYLFVTAATKPKKENE